jgi:hypothetical protein
MSAHEHWSIMLAPNQGILQANTPLRRIDNLYYQCSVMDASHFLVKETATTSSPTVANAYKIKLSTLYKLRWHDDAR